MDKGGKRQQADRDREPRLNGHKIARTTFPNLENGRGTASSFTNYWLSIDFVASGEGSTEGNVNPNQISRIVQINASLNSAHDKNCIRQWGFNLSSNNPVRIETVSTSKKADTKMRPFSNLASALSTLLSGIDDEVKRKANKQADRAPLVLLVTDGHFAFRNLLHREMAHPDFPVAISKKNFWWSYIEVGDIATAILSSEANKPTCEIVGIDAALTTLNFPPRYPRTPESVVQSIDAVIRSCLDKGILLPKPNQLFPSYLPAIISEETEVAPQSVVEVRHLPWTATPLTIATFFRGLNICPGGIAIKIADGRRSNTAFVCFESALDARLACVRDQHAISQTTAAPDDESDLESMEQVREGEDNNSKASSTNNSNRVTCLQTLPASNQAFFQHAVCDLPEVANFLRQLTDENQIVVRMRGLPYSAKKENIVTFFNEVDASIFNGMEGIFLVNYPDKRPTGDAFVIFPDDATADRALTRHRNYLGQRYVELFKASPSEQAQVCQIVARTGQTVNSNNSKKVSKITKGQIVDEMVWNNFSLPTSQLAENYRPRFTNPFPIGELATSLLNRRIQKLVNIFPPIVSSGHNCVPNLSCFIPSAGDGREEGDEGDLNDPTDPLCPFQRPLPARGAQTILQVLDLPPTATRHEMRLFLGPMNFSKTDGPLRGSWLLLLSDKSEAVQLVEKLGNKPFASKACSAFICGPLYPRFMAFEISRNGRSTATIPLPNVGAQIVQLRLPGIPAQLPAPLQAADLTNKFPLLSGPTIAPRAGMPLAPHNAIISAAVAQSTSLLELSSQTSSWSTPNTEYPPTTLICSSPLAALTASTVPAAAAAVAAAAGNMDSFMTPITPLLHGPPRPAPGNTSDCILQVSGLPCNVSPSELIALYAPVAHLLSMQPQFIPFNVQGDGTCSFLVVFGSLDDAERVATHCPVSTLRDNTAVAIISRLWQPSTHSATLLQL